MSKRGVFIAVHIQPNAARNELTGIKDDIWQVRISAAPIKGQANKELLDFLGKILGVGKSNLSIVKGHASRHKLIEINGLTQEEIAGKLMPGS